MTRNNLASTIILFLILFTMVGCVPAEPAREPPIRIGVIGPMESIHGQHHWYGATMAADEINKDGGIRVGKARREIELLKIDSNELKSVQDARTAMERAITVEQVDFVVGGFEIMAALEMQDVIADHETIWLGCGVAVSDMCRRVGRDYERYKYWFRAGPVNSWNIGQTNIAILEMIRDTLREELGVERPRVAILAEDAPWVDQFGLLEFYHAFVPDLNMEIVGVWRPAPDATDLTTELGEVIDSKAHIILFNAQGPVGVDYARQWVELEVPAASTGIHFEAMKSDFFEATGGKADYITCWHAIARVEMTRKTIPFYDAFVEQFGEQPLFTATTYDGVFLLKEAIEKAGTLDAKPIIAELEDIDYAGAFGRIRFTPRGFLQMGDEIPHDLTWGPDYATSVGVQWQDGEPRCVWPWEWNGLTYENSVRYELPPWVIDYWRDTG